MPTKLIELITEAHRALERCNTIPLATAGFLVDANAISQARVALDRAVAELQREERINGRRTDQPK